MKQYKNYIKCVEAFFVLLVVLIALILIFGCQNSNEQNPREDNTFNAELITIVIDGQQHEFVGYYQYGHFGLSHWPECRFCKNGNPEGNPD